MNLKGLIYSVPRLLLGFFGFGQGNCMYYPTCSSVISEEIDEKGFIKSIYLIGYRAYICNPIYRKFGKIWQ
tara:strand:+ start:321 stop:533 length:213 start_codon:yes stop_codon:yes gene_type:complete